MATNPVASLPDADAVRAALRACELSIVSEAMRATDTVDACRIRLPALAWAEKDGTVTNSERGISRQRPFLPPPGEARQDWWIIAEVARRLGHGEAFAWKGVADIFREHASALGLRERRPARLRYRRLCRHRRRGYDPLEPFVWPARKDAPTGEPLLRRGRLLPSRRRAPASSPRAAREPLHAPSSDWPLRLNTGRVRDQWHTMTRTGKSPRLAGHRPEPTIELQPDRCRARGLAGRRHCRSDERLGPRRAACRICRRRCARATPSRPCTGRRSSRAPAASMPRSIPRSIRFPASPSSSTRRSRSDACRSHGMARFSLAGRSCCPRSPTGRASGAPATTPTCWRASSRLAAARRALSAAMRAANPGPWLDGEDGLGAVISDGRLEAVLGIGKAHDEAARDRLAPFMAMAQLDVEQRRVLLHGGDAADRGGEICACFGVSCASVRDGDRQWRDDARCRRRRHQGRHELRLLPAGNSRPAARARAPRQGGVMQTFPHLPVAAGPPRAGGRRRRARRAQGRAAAVGRRAGDADRRHGGGRDRPADRRGAHLAGPAARFDDDDLSGMALVIVATDDEALAGARLARRPAAQPAGQRRRPAASLQLHHAGDRRSRADHHRHLDRRRGARAGAAHSRRDRARPAGRDRPAGALCRDLPRPGPPHARRAARTPPLLGPRVRRPHRRAGAGRRRDRRAPRADPAARFDPQRDRTGRAWCIWSAPVPAIPTC